MSLGRSRLVSPVGAQAEGLAPVIPQHCPGDGSGEQCSELHPLQTPLFFWQEDLCHQDTEFLCAQLKVLATESNKYRAKTDRRKQRSIFRDILRFIEVPEAGSALPCRTPGCAAAAQLPGDSPSLCESQGMHRAGTQIIAGAPLSTQSGEYQEETIRFGLECMYLDSWARQRTYQAFKEVLGSGICHHLQVGSGRLHWGCWAGASGC